MTITFQAPDVECERCVDTVTAALADVDGVRAVDVDLEARTVTVDYDEARLGAAMIRATLEDAGYPTIP
jgi:copper chaperone